MKNPIQNNDGYALYITILLIFFVATIGISLLTLTANANKTTLNERDDQAFFYFAEAGVNLEKSTLTEVISNIDTEIRQKFSNYSYEEQTVLLNGDDFPSYYYSQLNDSFCNEFNDLFKTGICNDSTNTYSNSFDLTSQFGQQPKVDTTVTFDCNPDTECAVLLEGTGYYEDDHSKQRSVSQKLVIDADPRIDIDDNDNESVKENDNSSATETIDSSNPLTDYAAITNGNISMKGKSTIYGNAGSLQGQITNNGQAKVTGSTITPSLPQSNQVNTLIQYLPNFPVSQMDAGKTLPIDDKLSNEKKTADNVFSIEIDTRINYLTLSNKETLTLDIGNRDVNLYVDILDLNKGALQIIGTGKLNIFTNTIINLHGYINEGGNPASLNIFYDNFDDITINGGTQIYGSFYTKNSDLTLNGGAGFYGNLYSGGSKINISGQVPSNGQWLVAPYADLDLKGGANIKGTVITNSIDMAGGTSISYGEPLIPNPAIPPISDNPSPYLPSTSSDFLIEGPLQETDL